MYNKSFETFAKNRPQRYDYFPSYIKWQMFDSWLCLLKLIDDKQPCNNIAYGVLSGVTFQLTNQQQAYLNLILIILKKENAVIRWQCLEYNNHIIKLKKIYNDVIWYL